MALDIRHDGNIIILHISAIVGRQDFDAYMNTVQAVSAEWPDDKLYLCLHDFSEAKQVDWMHQSRERFVQVAEQYLVPKIGRLAFVLPRTSSRRLLDTFIHRQLSTMLRQSNLSVRSFSSVEDAKQWLGQGFDLESYERRAEALLQQAEYLGALQVYRAMLVAVQSEGNDQQLAHVYNALADISYELGHYDELKSYVESALQLTAGMNDATGGIEHGRAMLHSGLLHRLEYHYEKALEVAEEALNIFLKHENKKEEANTYAFMGSMYQLQYQLEEAIRYYQKALVLYQLQDDPSAILGVLQQLGSVQQRRGEYHEAIRYLRQALTRSIELANQPAEISSLAMLGSAQLRYGDFQSAARNLSRVIQITERAEKRPGWIFYSHAYLAEAYVRQQKLEKAIELANGAYQMAQASKLPGQLGLIMRIFGLIAAEQGQPIRLGEDSLAAETCFQRSIQTFTEIKQDQEKAYTLRDWAHLAFRRNQVKQGTDLWQRAYDIFLNLGMRHEVEQMANLPGNL